MKTKDYKSVIDKICCAKKVISSSLHGIILAESYGVPAIFYQDLPNKFNYKYEDWYLSTCRKDYIKASSIKEAIDTVCTNLPNLDLMRENLIKSFPYDLWS